MAGEAALVLSSAQSCDGLGRSRCSALLYYLQNGNAAQHAGPTQAKSSKAVICTIRMLFLWVKHLQKDLQPKEVPPEEPVCSTERSLARLHLVPTPSVVTTLSLPELFQN